MKKTTALLLATAFASVALAQEPASVDKTVESGPAEAEVQQKSKLTIEGELLWTNAYVSDGYVITDEGLILQPQVTLAYEAYSSENLTLTPWFNVWANVTDEEYNKGDYFDELDLAAGLEAATGPITLGAQFTWYTSPVDSFDDIHELGFSVSLDDQSLTEWPISLNPYAALYIETRDRGGPEGSFVELGIEPTYAIEDWNLTLSLPITTAFNVDEQYFDDDGDDELLGYVMIGFSARYDITDNWYAAAGVEYWILTADSTEASNDGDDTQWVGKVAVGFSY
jgi:hypothetical protein